MLDVLHTGRLGRWLRPVAAVLCLALAAVSAVSAHRSAPTARTVPVLVAARPLAAGRVLVASDVRVERWPADRRPPATPAGVHAVTGRRVSGAVAAGEAITPPRLLGAGIADGLARGQRAIPLVASGATAALVRAGDHVDVLAGPEGDVGAPDGGAGGSTSTQGQAQVVVTGALVLAVLPGPDGGPASVVVAGDEQAALRATRLGPGESVSVIVLPP